MTENELKQIEYFQKKSFEVFENVVRVCNEKDIKYVLTDGSLLGAVRHGGFIPWDDDLDIAITRDEYNKLIESMSELNDEILFTQVNQNDKFYFQHFAKLRNIDANIREEYMAHFDIVHGIWVDVFPYDRPLKDKTIEMKRAKRINKWHKLWGFITPVINRNDNENAIKTFVKTTVRNMVIKSQAKNGIIIKVISKYYNHTTLLITGEYYTKKGYELSEDYWICYSLMFNKNRSYEMKTMKNEYFAEVESIEFEDTKVLVPNDYDGMLSNIFGNYMELPKTENRRTTHHIVDKNGKKYIFD